MSATGCGADLDRQHRAKADMAGDRTLENLRIPSRSLAWQHLGTCRR